MANGKPDSELDLNGKPCERCGSTKRYFPTKCRPVGRCVDCHRSTQNVRNKGRARRLTPKQRNNLSSYQKKRRITHPDSPEKKAKKAEYARNYRKTAKGKLVNRVGQSKNRVKRLQAEGSHTTAEWEALLQQYGYHCLKCGKHQSQLDRVLEQDHVVSIINGGSDYIANIQVLCHECNGAGGKWKKNTDYRPRWEGYENPGENRMIRLKMKYVLVDGSNSSLQRVTELYHGDEYLETIPYLQDVPAKVKFWTEKFEFLEQSQ